MDIDETWKNIVAAEGIYVSNRMALYASGGAADRLRTAFGSWSDRETALRFLRDIDIDLVIELLDEVVDYSLTINRQGWLAEQILSRVPREALRPALERGVIRFLARDDLDNVDFWTATGMLDALKEPSTKLLDAAAASDDPEVQEVASFYVNR